MMNKENPLKDLIEQQKQAFQDAISKMPTKEGAAINALYQDMMSLATSKSELTDIEAAEKVQQLTELSKKLADYGVEINK